MFFGVESLVGRSRGELYGIEVVFFGAFSLEVREVSGFFVVIIDF